MQNLKLAFVGLMFCACASGQSAIEKSKAHHTKNGFQNTDGKSGDGDKNFFSTMLRFASGEFKASPPQEGYESFEKNAVATPDFSFKGTEKEQANVTWLGHAGVLLQIEGMNFLFDPIFSKRASPVSFAGAERRVRSPVQAQDLPRIDGIFISHNHYDHLDNQTIEDLLKDAKDPQKLCAYVPLKMGEWFKARGYTCVTELDWWDRVAINDKISVVATPSHHWSRRGLFDRNQVLWAGFLVEKSGPRPFRFIHVGDTGYSDDFKEIGKRLGPIDLAAIPVGAYEPRDFMQDAHVSPKEAVQIMQDLKAKKAFGIHWGTFELTKEPLDQPPVDLAKALAESQISPQDFLLFKQGESKRFD
jgi:N-acyl-phosphatidylethanolamine-hydrolysing phospholipase D